MANPAKNEASATQEVALDENGREAVGIHDTRPGVMRDWETAEGLIDFIREKAAAEDGSGEWLPFALMDYDRKVREDERARKRAAPTRLPENDAILTPDEAAEILAIPRKTVIALCAAQRLEGAFKAGRRWRIPGRAVRKMAGEVTRACR